MIRLARRLNPALRRLGRDESGLSMTELLVAATLTSIVMVMVGSFFVQTAKLTTAASDTRDSNGAASNIANGITSVVRVATTLAKAGSEIPDPAIVSGTRSSLTINSYANTNASNPAPVRVTFTLDAAGVVTETRCTGSAASGFWKFAPCVSTTSRILGSGVLAPTGVSNQLFTYRDGSGNPMLIGTGSLSSAQLAEVSSIVVQVRAQSPNSTTDPVFFTNTVVLRNLGLETTS